MIEFTTEFPPSINERYAHRSTKVLTGKYREYKRSVYFNQGLVGLRPNRGSWVLGIELHYKRDVDVDNYVKALLDGLQQRLFEDDKQVVSLTVTKRRAEGSPKAVVKAQCISDTYP